MVRILKHSDTKHGEGNAQQPKTSSRLVIKSEAHDANLQIHVLEEQTAREVDAIRRSAADAATARRNAAWVRGREAGLRDGALEAAAMLLRGIIEARDTDHLQAAEVRDLMHAIAAKLFGPDTPHRADAEVIAQERVNALRHGRWMRLDVNTEDAVLLRTNLPALLDHAQAMGDFSLAIDALLTRNQCRIITDGVQLEVETHRLSSILCDCYAAELTVRETPLPNPNETS
ncbi:MAG: hypothetical protein Q7S96_03600 [bacterium]|nr:hypothetical protein [bacterium]